MPKQPYNLFLDDLRSPQDAYDQEKHEMFTKKEWVVVRNYDEFVSYIHNNGLPELVSFDHDLHEEHYTPKEYWADYEKSMLFQDAASPKYTNPTGYECAQFLIDYCEEYQKPLPEYYSHSANPVGRDRINDILFYYKRYSGKTFDTTKKTILRKALVYCGQFVDMNRLYSGIYTTTVPQDRAFDTTIKDIIEFYEEHAKSFGRELSQEFRDNINQCELKEIEISFKL